VCSECHAKELAAWSGSDHDLAMQVADDKAVLGDFANGKFRYAATTSTFSRRDGKYVVNTDGPDGKLHDYEIKYAFGVHPLQQYLVELPGGFAPERAGRPTLVSSLPGTEHPRR
jgi:hypothetical protein